MIGPFLTMLFLMPAVLLAQKKETRDVPAFQGISYRVPGKLYLRQGSPQKVEIEGDPAILEKIETRTEGSRLIIETARKWFDWDWNDEEVTVYITVKDIESIGVSGSGDLIAQTKITAENLDLKVSGSGSLKAEVEARGVLEAGVSGSGNMAVMGKCKTFDSNVSGSGRIMADGMTADNYKISISGSGKIQAKGSAKVVRANVSGSGKVLAAEVETERCEVRISGSGDVEINVKEELDAHISGSGTVGYKGNPKKVNSNSSGSGHVKKL